MQLHTLLSLCSDLFALLRLCRDLLHLMYSLYPYPICDSRQGLQNDVHQDFSRAVGLFVNLEVEGVRGSLLKVLHCGCEGVKWPGSGKTLSLAGMI